MRFNYFSNLAQNMNFTQLRELHLHWIEIQYDSLKSFLNTAKATLDTLTLESVTMSDDISPETDESSAVNGQRRRRDKMGALWQRVWVFLGNELSLKTFSVWDLGYRGLKVSVMGYGDGGQKGDSARFDADLAGISFAEWISHLRAVVTGECCDVLAVRHQGKSLT
jgi:hypothetical protein